MADNFEVNIDEGIQNINLDDINIVNDTIDDNNLLGVDLLVDPNKIKSSTSNEDLSYKNDDDISVSYSPKDPEVKNINTYSESKSIPLSDPILDNVISEDEGEEEYKPIHKMNSQDIKNEKIDLIYKFKKLESQGIRTTMNYTMNSHLDDMRNEYTKLKKQRELENSIKFQRKMLMACITGIEFLNGRFDPFSVKLDGWSESVNENINDYDEVFEELAEKYSGPGESSPELRLLFMLGGSAFMFHLTNTMFKTSLPGMDQILSQNPELKKQFAEAAVNGMSGNNNNTSSGGGMPNMMSMMSGLMGGGRENMNNYRAEMNPPDNDLDDIINQMNLNPNNIDLDSISLNSGESKNDGITLNI
uniref:Uncharacterized protein n=1 Tax=viral metagenome TaxID=1070528 RepID=A0A6C0CXY4_9ZZZZ